MSFESIKKQPISTNEAMIMVRAVRDQAEVMGANDYEPSAFKRLQESLESGEITPEKAIEQAENILNDKQDYH